MTPQHAFVGRLRRYRERRRLTVDDLAAATRIRGDLLEAFEENDLSEWPRGLYARAWVRAYAHSVGLEPGETVEEFCRLYPQGDRRAAPLLHEIAAIVSHPSAYRDEFSHHDRRCGVRPHAAARPFAWFVALARAVQRFWWRLASVLTAGPPPRLKRSPRASS